MNFQLNDEIKKLKDKIEDLEEKNENLEKDNKRYKDMIEKSNDTDTITKFMVNN